LLHQNAETEFTATAWKGGTFGIKISAKGRDKHFRREWKTMRLMIASFGNITVNIDKDSFWKKTCHELISVHLGNWMMAEHLAPWPHGHPPKFTLRPTSPGVFEVSK